MCVSHLLLESHGPCPFGTWTPNEHLQHVSRHPYHVTHDDQSHGVARGHLELGNEAPADDGPQGPRESEEAACRRRQWHITVNMATRETGLHRHIVRNLK